MSSERLLEDSQGYYCCSCYPPFWCRPSTLVYPSLALNRRQRPSKHGDLTLRFGLSPRAGFPPADAPPPEAAPAFEPPTPLCIPTKDDAGSGTSDAVDSPPPVPVGAGASTTPMIAAVPGPIPAAPLSEFPSAAATLTPVTAAGMRGRTVAVPRKADSSYRGHARGRRTAAKNCVGCELRNCLQEWAAKQCSQTAFKNTLSIYK